MRSPTQLSLKHLRDNGYTVAITEFWNPYGRVRIDLYGIFDLIAIKEGEFGVLGIQTTSKSNISARINKAKKNKNLFIWLKTGNNFIVHGWGKEKGKWTLTEKELIKKKYLPTPVKI